MFLAAYQEASGEAIADAALWDRWALARSHEIVDTWSPNYAPLGRGDLDARELRRRHSLWSDRLAART